MIHELILLYQLGVLPLFPSDQAQLKQPDSNGKVIFETRCTRCHGLDGGKQRLGAKDLRKSSISDEAIVQIITRGKFIMPSWKKELSEAEIRAVAAYIKQLRQP